MPFDSNGIWSLTAGYLGVTGQTILPSNHNPPLEDIRDNGLSAVLVRDGRAPMTGNLNMGTTNKIVNLAAGTSPTDAVNKTQLDDASAAGSVATQCRLSLSGANLLLSRFNGRYLTINGTPQLIPSAGVTLAPTGTTPGTVYFIYAYMNSGTMTLEASTTTYVIDTTTGMPVKTGDTTRTLVGMAYPTTGPVWVDSSTQAFVISYFNRQTKRISNAFTGNQTTPSNSPTEISPTIRCEFLSWAGSSTRASASGALSTNTAGVAVFAAIGFDGTSPEDGGCQNSANFRIPINALSSKVLSQTYHYATLLGWAETTATATYIGNASALGRTSLTVEISG